MAGSSIPPSSISSFQASSCAHSSTPSMPFKNRCKTRAEYMQEYQDFSPSTRHQTNGMLSFMEDEPDYDVEVTTKMTTTVTTTIHHLATPQPQSPSLSGSRKHLASPPTSPLRGKWYAVTVGQDIGVFDDWLLVQELIDRVMGARQKGYKTFEQALARYSDKYFGSTVFCLLFPGSHWFQPIEDWIPQQEAEEWTEKHEEAVRQAESNSI
ncbi:hypothetical protein ARMGADRAFT_1089547 [Armillaria gallica]|uniref:Ribonuclease H1 N-terminal domain-containing protein n=1 Tax=Armillaria gallica TaxID=47427 RepID=A0A2H3D4F5_ARMGA|nr:hypothetical protein ARMGADRAFT_1089547 [Armillaria gallica]